MMTLDKFFEEYPEENFIGSPSAIMRQIVEDEFKAKRCVNCDDIDVCEIYSIVEDDYEPEEFGCTDFKEIT